MYPERMLREPGGLPRPGVLRPGAAAAGRVRAVARGGLRDRPAKRAGGVGRRRAAARPARGRPRRGGRCSAPRRSTPPSTSTRSCATWTRSSTARYDARGDPCLTEHARRPARDVRQGARASTTSATSIADGRVRPHLRLRRRPARRRSPTRAGCSPGMSLFWFEQFAGRRAQPPDLRRAATTSRRRRRATPTWPAGRCWCTRLTMLPIECVVRGYLVGLGLEGVPGHRHRVRHALPAGLREAEQLPEPIFTPSTKADDGHDENIDFEAAGKILSATTARRAASGSRWSSTSAAADYAADARASSSPTPSSSSASTTTDQLVLSDEVLTPDSSRFWPADDLRARQLAAVVRQAVRARLAGDARLGQDSRPAPSYPTTWSPAPQQRYVEAYERSPAARSTPT